jgi:ubiquinone biosynthesis protein
MRWRRAAAAMPRLAAAAVRHGVLPSGLAAARTARSEGLAGLHWKVLGDGLVRFLRNAGPVFTKLGQILATRSDLLPAAVCARLESLYAQQPAMTPRQLRRELRRAYGRQLPFDAIDETPIAVGSIGQVHRARLSDGAGVIVKVLRVGVEERVERDLEAARGLIDAWLALSSRERGAARELLSRCIDDLARGLAGEVDLRREAEALREFSRRFDGHPHVRIPVCFEALSSRRILVMEELEGEPLAAYRRRAKADPEASRRIANLALTEILRQIFEDGRFHADPHAGNLLVLPDGRLGLVDLGLVGELGDADRRRIARAVRAFLSRDADALFRALLGFGSIPGDFDAETFKQELRRVAEGFGSEFAARLRGRASADREGSSLEDFVAALFSVAARHGIHVPTSSTLLIKTLVTIEGVARSLHPELDLAAVAAPVVLRSLTPRWMRWLLRRSPPAV